MTLPPSPAPPNASVKTVLIPTAGRSSRLFPITKVVPKTLLPVGRRPLIHYAVEEATMSGAERVIFVVSPGEKRVMEYFVADASLEKYLEDSNRLDDLALLRHICSMASIIAVEQPQPLGLADAIRCARHVMDDESFGVILPDALITADHPGIGQLMDAHQRNSSTLIATREVQPRETDRYGIIAFDRDSSFGAERTRPVSSLVEKPSSQDAPSLYGIFGRYILEPWIFDAIDQTAADSHGEIQLTASLDLGCQQHPVYGFLFEGKHIDTGEWNGLMQANFEFAVLDVSTAENQSAMCE